MNHPWIEETTAPMDSMLHSPGRIILAGPNKPGESSTGVKGEATPVGNRKRHDSHSKAAAN